MVKPKTQSKKHQKHGVDFKKIKRKLGRKLPPPKNTTNTEIKSKAIILPEQSVASERTGSAVSKKGLTLKELLQQTSHHNGKVRKDALIGIRDIFTKYPAELKLHKLAAIEKLRERISDEDKLVRETLYQLLKSVVFPGSKEDNQELVVSLIMSYIFNAMTHLAIDIRLMAFKFLDLVLHYFPTSFSLYTEKILQSYEDLLRRNQFSLQDKSKLKSALVGLVHCLSLLQCNKREDDSSSKNDDHARGMLLSFEPDDPEDLVGLVGIVRKLMDLLPVLVSCFQDLLLLAHNTSALDAQSFDCMLPILQSVDIMVKFFNRGIGKNGKKFESPLLAREDPNVTVVDEMISPSILKKLWDAFPINPMHHVSGKDNDRYFMLNAIISEIFLQMSGWNYFSPALIERFLDFIEISLTEKICNGRQSSKSSHEKHILPLIFFIPRLITRVPSYWKLRILQAFTNVFRHCNPDSSMKLACLSAIEEMLDPEQYWFSSPANDPEILEYQINWIRELPSLLILLGDTHPSNSKAVLHLQLRLGQSTQLNSPLSWEYGNMQHMLKDFYCSNSDEMSICYGPFIRLPRDIQELSVCCLYYFSLLDPLLLQSLSSCCLCHDLEPLVVSRILEVLHSACKAGHIQLADYFSFNLTLLSRFKVYPENIFSIPRDGEKSNRGTFKSITSSVCSHLSQIGDSSLIFHMLEKIILGQIMLRPSVDNICALLRVLVTLDSKPSRLSEESVTNLSNVLAEYLIYVSSREPEDDRATSGRERSHYFYLPSFVLFHRNAKLLKLVLNVMGSFVDEYGSSGSSHHHIYSMDVSIRPGAIVSVLLHMTKDWKIQRVLLSCRTEMENILQKMLALKSSKEIDNSIEGRHKMQIVCDRLKAVIDSSFSGTPLI